MTISRRSFVSSLGAAGAASLVPVISARGLEASRGDLTGPVDFAGDDSAHARIVSPAAMRLDSNENPNGPGEHALQAIRDMFAEAGRYADMGTEDVRKAIASKHGVGTDSVMLGVGSTEILRMSVYAFTSPAKALVTAAPTFEDPARQAEVVGAPIRTVPVTGTLKLDLDGMASQSSGAGLVFVCNPNNPTATVHGSAAIKDFVARVLRDSPDTTILIDEAYHEYVDDPAYASAIPLAMEQPRVIVSRTFSKVFGMAGLRLGYAIARPETVKALARYRLPNGMNVPVTAAAIATVNRADHIESERAKNREAKDFTHRFFEGAGYRVGVSETNFLMIDIRRDTREFQNACRARGILVGRPFPPLNSWTRISIGTMDEMRQATDVFKKVLVNG